MRISLKVTEGPRQGEVFSFDGHDTFIVGRGDRATFRPDKDDRFFSRFHFLVEVNPPHCRLTDMGSRNGTMVNGKKVKVADLKDGDSIKAGHTILKVSVEGQAPIDTHEHVEQPTIDPHATRAPSTAPQTLEPVATVPTPIKTPAPARRAPTGTKTPATSARSACRVCAAPLAKAVPAGATDFADAPNLCSACQQSIVGQPQTIPGYRIVKKLGEGGMGVVYLALRVQDGSLVALKKIIPAVAGNKKQVERFLREASILKELEHEHIVAFRDMGEAAGQLYFAMDFIRGTDAAGILKANGRLPVPRAVRLICQMLEALEYAHGRGFVHRDIKPANLLVAETDGKETALLADFGLARVYQTSQLSGLTMTGELGGTLAFMAPEQITAFRESKPGVDQYAAGAALYNLLTDKLLFDFPPSIQKALPMILNDEPVPIRKRRPGLPEELAEVIHKSVAKDPKKRFADVRGLRKALGKYTRP